MKLLLDIESAVTTGSSMASPPALAAGLGRIADLFGVPYSTVYGYRDKITFDLP
ncbi:hypothetical protein ACFY19_28965 [Streptosporangium saharense]|uniref:hypothetical protein n=1 Tax=Streptosporangium saharense TaxID=1706840 RepID=UPI00367543E4